jgi:N-acetylglucosamine kinase-like BadF-type ATPase
MTDIIVGIDGGGSKTLVAAAGLDGEVLRLVRGPATSPLEAGGWQAALAEQVRPFSGLAGLRGAVAALPAHGEVAEVSAAQCRLVATLFKAVPQRVLNDVDAAHLGAFAGGPGILVLSGTGSMAWARDHSGVSYRTGGWGEVVGDEGSGYWIGKRILGAVSQSLDGRAEPTALTEAVFAQLGLAAADAISALEGWAARLDAPRTQIAALAPLAGRLAEAGDSAALHIVAAAADELCQHVRTLERKLAPATLAWSYAGGSLSAPVLRRALVDRLGRAPQAPRLPPIGGALLAAARHLDRQIGDEWIERLARSLAVAEHNSIEANDLVHQETGNA